MNADNMAQIAERLKGARVEAGICSPLASAEMLGVSPRTAQSHEAGVRGVTRDMAARYAQLYGVDPEWILFGRERPGVTTAIRYSVQGGADPEAIRSPESADYERVEVPGGSGAWQAAKVEGKSMLPIAPPGSVVLFRDKYQSPRQMIGQVCVCELSDGRLLIKTLRRGSSEDLYDLDSTNADTLVDQRVIRAAKVEWIKRP